MSVWRALLRWWQAVWLAMRRPSLVLEHALALGVVDELLASPTGEAVRYAVTKVAADRSFHPSKDHEVKRREAIEWAGHWAWEHGVALRAWETRFVLEWTVGQRKGRLP